MGHDEGSQTMSEERPGVRRRGRTRVVVIALLMSAGFAAIWMFGDAGGNDADRTAAQPEGPGVSHSMRIAAQRDPDDEFLYYEGALESVRVVTAGTTRTVRSEVAASPWRRNWTGLADGEYVVTAGVRVCSGNCGQLEAPTATCERTVTLDRDLSVTVEFDYREGCTIAAVATDATEPADETPETLPCASGAWSSGDIDVFGPTDAADARAWPRTPEDAARRLLGGAIVDSLQHPSLGEAEPVVRPGAPAGARARALRYDVLEARELVGWITVEEIGFGRYAATQVEQCA